MKNREQELCAFFGEKVREVRRTLRLSMEDLADRMVVAGHHPISYQQLAKMEWGKNRASVGRARLIADALGVSISDLLPGAPERFPVEHQLREAMETADPRTQQLLSTMVTHCIAAATAKV